MDFLAQPATLRKLFEYITQDPSINPQQNYSDEHDTPNTISSTPSDQKRRFKYPFLACEILCSDIWSLVEAIFRDESLLTLLYSVLDRPAPLDPVAASYTSRVAMTLLSRRTSECLAHLRRHEGIADRFLVHLQTSTIVDLLLKTIACEESPEGVGTADWLCSADLIPKLVEKLGSAGDADVHENAGQALVDVIAVSGNVPSSSLITQLESPEQIARLFQHITASGSALLHGLTVVIELLKRHYKDPAEAANASEPSPALPPLLATSIAHFEQLHALLKAPPASQYTEGSENETMPTTTGPLSPPLGFYRLKIIEFFLAVLRTRYDEVEAAITSLGVINTTLDLFFRYPWNNFLHIATEQIVQAILESPNNSMKVHLLVNEHLLDRIVEANKVNISELSSKSGRRGYMGFLTSISLALTTAAQTNEELERVLAAHQGWAEYVATSLTDIRNIEMKPLGGHRPIGAPGAESSGDEEEEQPDSIYDRYKLGFSDNFTEDNADEGFDEYDDNEMSFGGTDAFANHSRGFAWKDADDDDKRYDNPNGSDSDEDAEELWVHRRNEYEAEGEGEGEEGADAEYAGEKYTEAQQEDESNGVLDDSNSGFTRHDVDADVVQAGSS